MEQNRTELETTGFALPNLKKGHFAKGFMSKLPPDYLRKKLELDREIASIHDSLENPKVHLSDYAKTQILNRLSDVEMRIRTLNFKYGVQNDK